MRQAIDEVVARNPNGMPVAVLAIIRSKFPGASAAITDAMIKNKISSIKAALRRKGKGGLRQSRAKIPGEIAKFIEEMVKDDPGVKPLCGANAVRQQFPNLRSEVTDKMLKAKISNVKGKYHHSRLASGAR